MLFSSSPDQIGQQSFSFGRNSHIVSVWQIARITSKFHQSRQTRCYYIDSLWLEHDINNRNSKGTFKWSPIYLKSSTPLASSVVLKFKKCVLSQERSAEPELDQALRLRHQRCPLKETLKAQWRKHQVFMALLNNTLCCLVQRSASLCTIMKIRTALNVSFSHNDSFCTSDIHLKKRKENVFAHTLVLATF